MCVCVRTCVCTCTRTKRTRKGQGPSSLAVFLFLFFLGDLCPALEPRGFSSASCLILEHGQAWEGVAFGELQYEAVSFLAALFGPALLADGPLPSAPGLHAFLALGPPTCTVLVGWRSYESLLWVGNTKPGKDQIPGISVGRP